MQHDVHINFNLSSSVDIRPINILACGFCFFFWSLLDVL